MEIISKEVKRIDNFGVKLTGYGQYQKILLMYDGNSYELVGLRAPRKGEVFSAELTTYRIRKDTRYSAKILSYEEKRTNLFDYTTLIICILQAASCLYGLFRGVNIFLIICDLVFCFTLYLYNARRITIGTNIFYFLMLFLNIVILIGVYYIPK